jgi:hypothetical protein
MPDEKEWNFFGGLTKNLELSVGGGNGGNLLIFLAVACDGGDSVPISALPQGLLWTVCVCVCLCYERERESEREIERVVQLCSVHAFHQRILQSSDRSSSGQEEWAVNNILHTIVVRTMYLRVYIYMYNSLSLSLSLSLSIKICITYVYIHTYIYRYVYIYR